MKIPLNLMGLPKLDRQENQGTNINTEEEIVMKL